MDMILRKITIVRRKLSTEAGKTASNETNDINFAKLSVLVFNVINLFVELMVKRYRAVCTYLTISYQEESICSPPY
jgi:hypothetical protein